jgi:hypothetical protein
VAISATTAQLINIKGHVPVTLNIGDSNFGTWHTFFKIAFRKFGLMNHVDGSMDSSLMFDDAEWLQIDTCIVSWLYTTLSDDLLSAVMQPDDDTYAAWTAIGSQFLDNIVQRTAQARQRLHALHQGDMSFADFCGQIKRLADVLRDVGSPPL